jgi:hypothetical protein
MAEFKKSLSEEYKRIKKAFEKIIKPKRSEPQLQWIPLPVRNKKF